MLFKYVAPFRSKKQGEIKISALKAALARLFLTITYITTQEASS